MTKLRRKTRNDRNKIKNNALNSLFRAIKFWYFSLSNENVPQIALMAVGLMLVGGGVVFFIENGKCSDFYPEKWP